MERFKNILFASFGGKEDLVALDRANRLAKNNKARITLVRVVEEISKAASYFLSKKQIAGMEEAVIGQAQNDLDNLTQKIDNSVEVETKILVGKPFIEIIRTILIHSHDIIIKAKQPSQKGENLDSADLHLLRKCPCPVWIIKPTQRKPFGKIIIAVDPDPSDHERLSLHIDLVKLGTSLAKNENSKVEVIHTWKVDGEATLRGPRFRMSDEELNSMAGEVQKAHIKWMDNLLTPFSDSKIKVSLVKGEPGPTLSALIEKKKPDIVLMGTVARTGLPGLLIGNTAELVLGQISCSVLTIKPRGFKTPVA